MCKAVEELIEDFVKIDRKDMALRMLEDGEMPLDKIAKYSNLSIEEVEELASASHSA